jgi:glycosyltransferase involved in cell wall biosynthesis
MIRNILFVSHSAEMSGAELTLLHLIQELDRTRFRPVLVIPGAGPLGEEAVRAKAEVRTVPYKWRLTERRNIWKQPLSWIWNRSGTAGLQRIIRERDIHLVFSNSAAAPCGAEAAHRLGLPHIWSVHEFLTGPNPLLHYLWGAKRLVRRIERMSCRVIVNSKATASSFAGSRGVRVVMNGVRPRPEEPLEDLKTELGLGNRPVLGVVGKLYREKGQKEAVRALGELRKSVSGIQLLLVGGVRDPRYKKEIENQIAAGGLEGHVHFLGQRRDGQQLMRLMQVLLIPSRIDSFGLAALDAMSMGTPVIALRAGGLPEIIRHNENGCLIPDLEPITVSEAVKKVLDNADFRASLIQAGLKTAREEFSVAKQAAATQRVMEECLSGERK